MIQFPEDFFWGAATSSHQVEGNNTNNDWWAWEASNKAVQPSGLSCNHYALYKEDFNLAKELNHNAHRLSIEWSRIQPEENKFCAQSIQHYKDALDALKQSNIEPVVTLHHFTNPLWFSQKGGWLNPESSKYFLSYVEKIVEELQDKVKFWVTINEPLIYVYYSYVKGDWPPQEKSFKKARIVRDNLTRAHIEAYKLIHSIYKKKNIPVNVSIAQNMIAFQACRKTFLNNLSVFLRDKFFNFGLIERLLRARALDFIGINYYTRHLVDINRWGWDEFYSGVCQEGHNNLPKNDMGWEIYPQGLYDILIKLKKYKLPVFVLENGICARDDNLRWDYISSHLTQLHRALMDGVKVIGYLYWSLLDNFEWDKGYLPRFGLIEVDYNNCKRRIRESARLFGEVCKTGKLDGKR